jgi:parallel beta-helix repeat protein
MGGRAYVIIFSVLLLPIVLSSGASVVQIPGDYSTIQAGIDDADTGDTVLVADGIYTGNGNMNLDFAGKAITVTSENGAESTVIDCAGMGRAFYFHSGETSSSILSGFTITNGSPLDAYRGAICCVNQSSPTIADNIIIGNPRIGIYCNDKSSPTIRNNVIERNRYEAEKGNANEGGGGVCCMGASSPVIEGNTIRSNYAGNRGGGIYVDSSSVKVMNNIIVGNSASDLGGGAYCCNSSPILVNNIIIGNSAVFGGGVFYEYICKPVIINSTISGNLASQAGGGIRFSSRAYATVLNTILWANEPDEIDLDLSSWVDITYSNIQGGWPGEGNMSLDPLFVDTNADDYRLSVHSPCIAAGVVIEDLDGIPTSMQPVGNPNIGAYIVGQGIEVLEPNRFGRWKLLLLVGCALTVMLAVGLHGG